MTLGRHVRVVAASALGAVIVTSLFAVLLVFSSGLNESWILHSLPITVGGAAGLGAVVAAALAYSRADLATVARVTRLMPKLTAVLAFCVLAFDLLRGLASQG